MSKNQLTKLEKKLISRKQVIVDEHSILKEKLIASCDEVKEAALLNPGVNEYSKIDEFFSWLSTAHDQADTIVIKEKTHVLTTYVSDLLVSFSNLFRAPVELTQVKADLLKINNTLLKIEEDEAYAEYIKKTEKEKTKRSNKAVAIKDNTVQQEIVGPGRPRK